MDHSVYVAKAVVAPPVNEPDWPPGWRWPPPPWPPGWENNYWRTAAAQMIAAASCSAEIAHPGVIELTPVADCYTWSTYPILNTGDVPYLMCGVSGSYDVYRTLIRFDLTDPVLLGCFRVTKATLKFWPKEFERPVQFGYFDATNHWEESQAAWIYRTTGQNWAAGGGPGNGNFAVIEELAPLDDPDYDAYDITYIVNEQVAGRHVNEGYCLWYDAAVAYVGWESRETAGEHLPILRIEYE